MCGQAVAALHCQHRMFTTNGATPRPRPRALTTPPNTHTTPHSPTLPRARPTHIASPSYTRLPLIAGCRHVGLRRRAVHPPHRLLPLPAHQRQQALPEGPPARAVLGKSCRSLPGGAAGVSRSGSSSAAPFPQPYQLQPAGAAHHKLSRGRMHAAEPNRLKDRAKPVPPPAPSNIHSLPHPPHLHRAAHPACGLLPPKGAVARVHKPSGAAASSRCAQGRGGGGCW